MIIAALGSVVVVVLIDDDDDDDGSMAFAICGGGRIL